MSEQPIYDYIKSNIVNGVLPADFCLKPYDRSRQRIRFADGAADGVAIYHMGRPDLPASLAEDIERGVSQACTGDYEGADGVFGELCHRHCAIELIDELQHYVIGHAEEIDSQALWAYATFQLRFATDKELVKVGLSFLELFGEPEEDVKQVVRTLGLSDEFTIFAAWCARGWSNGNDELFRLAKSTRGWGRIHVVEMIDPATDEIQNWLFHEGIDNYVMPEYSALTCYEKAGVATRLAGTMAHEDFSASTSIISAALSDSPVPGLFSLDDPRAELVLYVRQAKEQSLDLRDCECLDIVADCADERGWTDVVETCDALLASEDVRSLIESELEHGKGMRLALKLGIPFEDKLLAAMHEDFGRLYSQCGWLTDAPDYLPAVLELFREKVPLDSIADDPRDELGLGKEFDAYNKLDFLLQSLRHKMPNGLDFVMKALTSPTVRNRTMSHRVLRCWVSDEGRPLSELSTEAYEHLRYAYEKEPIEDLREAIRPLLDGKIEFGKDKL